jgi:regulator of sigma E protease
VQAKPQTGIVEGRAVLGFVLDNVGVVQLPFYLAPIEGARLTYQLLQGTAFGLYDFIASIFRGKGDFSSVAGPVGIVGIVGQTSQFGIAALLLLAAIISINLSIVNLIPFPALDGGRIFLVIVEGITGKAVPARIFEGLNIAGFAILILLMLAVTYHDISKLFI